MTSFNDYNSEGLVKMLLIGDSGSGKTGALASLANAGYRLFIYDFDNGLQVLRDYVEPQSRGNIYFKTFTDKLKVVNGVPIPIGGAKAFASATKALDQWTEKSGDEVIKMGNCYSWGSSDVLVIDSLSLMGEAAMLWTLQMENRLGQRPYQSDWGTAQDKCRSILQSLYTDAVKCHVIITAHIKFQGTKQTDSKGKEVEVNVHGYPAAPGRALSPDVPKYFNYMLRVAVTGAGAHTKRKLLTVPELMVPLKCPIKAPAELSLESGLAKIFELAKKAS